MTVGARDRCEGRATEVGDVLYSGKAWGVVLGGGGCGIGGFGGERVVIGSLESLVRPVRVVEEMGCEVLTCPGPRSRSMPSRSLLCCVVWLR